MALPDPTASESAASGSHRATEAEVALAQGIAKSNCVGECRLWQQTGDRSRGSSGARRCQFRLRRRVPPVAVTGRLRQR